ncbi:putative nucleic acid-binding protein [Kineosphaera limosa]|uniref:Ribonuclease VapC n=1 Tax=Kineosphaera limosa NBRC 100340 TaxID=1184609 RepID=K6WRD3_9MICO|nr:PIN domain-containing protein [Kineosphaera limosa]NYE01059.1 putative nucleic acid-binding protein [Kineosphaera limosa]GAB94657.1 hypothetical protein KILIM_008_00110 [Kineosphaera limosa NBRC 100340]
MTRVAVDTSVAVPLLVATHPAHDRVQEWARGRTLTLGGHALAETFSVLTRLPGDARLLPEDAAGLIDDNFDGSLQLEAEAAATVHREFAERGVAGGAVYDGLVAAAVRAHDVTLASRDARARGTYESMGVRVEPLT